MAMVNVNNLLNVKDSRWLQLEVCREFQRNKCTRTDTECKFAHPPPNVEVQNGRVTACYDSIKGRCNREKPPCKYFHPPQHLKDQLLINGRNHLALKNALMQQMGLTPGHPIVPGQMPAVAASPYLTGMPHVGNTFSPYLAHGHVIPSIMPPDAAAVSPLGVVSQTVVSPQKVTRTDRLECNGNTQGNYCVCQVNYQPTSSYGSVQCMPAFPGMVPYKRPAGDKSGVPVYQPNVTTYQQLMQLQQPFVPVSCEYPGISSPPTVTSNNTSIVNNVSSAGTTGAGVHPNSIIGLNSIPSPPMVAGKQTQNNNGTNNVGTCDNSELSLSPKTSAVVTSGTTAAASYSPALSVERQNLVAVRKSPGMALNSLAALTYTGVSLNKQMQQPAVPRLVNPYTNLLQQPMPPVTPQTVPTMNPQAFMMPSFPNAVPASRHVLIPQMGHNTYTPYPGLMGNVLAQYAAVNTNSNGTILNNYNIQPFKKMRTI